MADAPRIVPAREGYDRWAPLYDNKGNAAVDLKNREIRRLLGPVQGLEVADLGCGTGRHSIALAEAGAKVTAVDFSRGMLARARQRPGSGSIRFIERDLGEALPFADDSFDRVLCSLALEHVERLDVAFAEMRRICRPSGWIVVIEMHPALRLQDVAAGFRDPRTGEEIRPRSWGHQVSDFVMAALGAGLTPLEMQEPADRSAQPAWPLLLTMKLTP
ncbi:MAG: methyltransferase domain-containing protein [Acidobacteria bacterium]|nr:methyltransferase domain-containing protein [Acidobacteriota bacterium]